MEIRTQPFISGAAITFLLVILFPVGVILSVTRFLKHREYTYLRIADWRMGGNYFLFAFFMTSMIMAAVMSEPMDVAVVWIMYALMGASTLFPSLYFFGKAKHLTEKMEVRFKGYRRMILEEGVTSITQLARNVFTDPQIVRNELRYMIWIEELSDVTTNGDEIIVRRNAQATENKKEAEDPAKKMLEDMLNQSAETVTSTSTSRTFTTSSVFTAATVGEGLESLFSQGQPAEPAKPKTVECSSCGAKYVLNPRENKECEYCFSIVHYD